MLRRATLRNRPWRSPTAFQYSTQKIAETPHLIDIKGATFYRQYPSEDDGSSNPPLFPDLNFELPVIGHWSRFKQFWAVVGTTSRLEFLNILRGQHISIPPSARSYPHLLTDTIAKKNPNHCLPENAIQYVAFSGEGSRANGGTRGAYLSARYESFRDEADWTVEQYLRGQTLLNPMEGDQHGIVRDETQFRKIITDFKLSALLGNRVSNLSNGQTRRVGVAKAVLKEPELLILDEPFVGLDPPAVGTWSRRLHTLAIRASPRIILSFHDLESLPDWINHLVLVGNNNQILFQGPREQANKMLAQWEIMRHPAKATADVPATVTERVLALKESGALDDKLFRELVDPHSDKRPVFYPVLPGGEPLIEMTGVRVKYGSKVALGDWDQDIYDATQPGLRWRVRRGQRWALLGANGSGKTTLLSLITSDHPQAYAQPIKLFGKSRLPEPGKPGISLFELQSRIGHSSPEIHAFFPRQLTIREAIESAFAETFLSKPDLTVERDRDVTAFLDFFKPELDQCKDNASKDALNTELCPVDQTNTLKYTELMHSLYATEYADNVLFGDLDTARQRIVLFIRALIRRPDIVILDEALSGLDYHQRNKCLRFLDHGSASDGLPGLSDDQALIVVSHSRQEIPDSVRYFMRLPFKESQGRKIKPFRIGIIDDHEILRGKRPWDRAWTWDRRKRKKDEELASSIPDVVEYNLKTL